MPQRLIPELLEPIIDARKSRVGIVICENSGLNVTPLASWEWFLACLSVARIQVSRKPRWCYFVKTALDFDHIEINIELLF
jgi:hypothetical protein